jgi:hypothetical protein
LNLSQYVSKWLEIFLTYIVLYDLQDPKAADPKNLKERRYDKKNQIWHKIFNNS